MKKYCQILFPLVCALLTHCAGADIFPSIGTGMASPTNLAVDSDRSRLYVINSNYKVSYEEGSLHVVDISNPASPARVNLTALPSFSGETYLDTTNQLLYTTNRLSSNDSDTTDALFRIDVNESSAGFLARTDFTAGDDPYGIKCCDSANRLFVAAGAGIVDSYEVSNSLAHSSQSLATTVSDGRTFRGEGSTRLVVLGSQAVVANKDGGLWIVDLNELGGVEGVDYIITDIPSPRGLATDGTYIYVVSVDRSSGTDITHLIVLNIASLTAVSGNTTSQLIDKDDSGLVFVGPFDFGGKDPQEIVLSGSVAYITNLGADTVSVVNVDLAAQTATAGTAISVGDEPFGMALYSPGGTATHLFVANSGSGSGGNTVSVIDLSTNSVVATYP